MISMGTGCGQMMRRISLSYLGTSVDNWLAICDVFSIDGVWHECVVGGRSGEKMETYILEPAMNCAETCAVYKTLKSFFDAHSIGRHDKLNSELGIGSFWSEKYEGVSKIYWTDAVKVIKLTIRPIGCHHPRSSSLPHGDTGPTVFLIFGMLPEVLFCQCQAHSAIWPGSPQWYQTDVLSASISFLEIGRSHRVPN
jgi:hypothetical protein